MITLSTLVLFWTATLTSTNVLDSALLSHTSTSTACIGEVGIPATSSQGSAPTNDTSIKRYPELEALSLGFTSSDIATIDRKRLEEGFVILNDATGRSVYELPIRLRPGKVDSSYLSSKYVFIVCAVTGTGGTGERPCIVGAYRPTGIVDGTIKMADLDAMIKQKSNEDPEAVLITFLSGFPKSFFPNGVRENYSVTYRLISTKRRNGDYLSPVDAAQDISDFKLYVLDTLNSALVAYQLQLPEHSHPQFRFERALVQTRNLSRNAEIPAGQKLTSTSLNAIRLLNSEAIRAKIYGFKPEPDTFRSNGYTLELDPWNEGTYEYRPKIVDGVRVVPFPTSDRIRSLAVIREGYLGTLDVLPNGDLRHKSGSSQMPVQTYRP